MNPPPSLSGVYAAVLCVLLPRILAHDRIVGHETPSVFFWTLLVLLALRVAETEHRNTMLKRVAIMGMVGGGLYPNLAYHTSKGALVNMTRALAAEWGGRGVRVNGIAPTYVNTELTANLRADAAMVQRIEERTPLGRFADPQDMAGGILYLASPAAAMVTGHILAIDGGWLAI